MLPPETAEMDSVQVGGRRVAWQVSSGWQKPAAPVTGDRRLSTAVMQLSEEEAVPWVTAWALVAAAAACRSARDLQLCEHSPRPRLRGVGLGDALDEAFINI